MKKTLVITIDWTVRMLYKKPFYNISAIYGIKIDKEGHSAGDFYYHAGDNERELADVWKEYRAWANDYNVYALWDDKPQAAIDYANSLAKKSSRRLFYMDVYKLYKGMIPGSIETTPDIGEALDMLGLTCDKKSLNDIKYRTKAIVRIYRKLRRQGEKLINEDIGQLIYNEQSYPLLRHRFFPELNKKEDKKRIEAFTSQLDEIRLQCEIEEGYIYAASTIAYWKIPLDYNLRYIYCQMKGYYRGTRKVDIEKYKELGANDRIQMMTNCIVNYEKEYAANVGNSQISVLLDKIGKRMSQEIFERQEYFGRFFGDVK